MSDSLTPVRGEQGPNRSSRYRTAYKEILEDLIAGLDAEICKDESLSVSAWGSLLGDILDALDNAYVFHFDRLEVSNDWLIQIRWSAKHERFRDNLRELIRRTLADDALDASHRFDRCRKYLDYLARSIQTNMSGSSEMSPREEEAWTILSGRILAQLTRSIWFNHSALQRHIHRLNRAKSGKGSAIGSYGGLLRSICMATRTIDLAMTLKNKLDKVDCLTAKSDERNAFDAEADSAREYVAHYLPQVVTDLRGLIPQESGSREDQMFESVVSRAKRIAPDFEIKTAEAEQIETFQPA